MRKIPYLIFSIFFIAFSLQLPAQACRTQSGWGYVGMQTINGIANLFDRTFSGNRSRGNDPMYERANQAFLQGDYEAALQGFSNAMENNPGNRNFLARLRYQRGICHYILGEYEAAKTDFNAAIRFRPDVPDAYYFRGKIY